jgi:FKBP12-rapamycin complex-associated protein
LTEEFTRYNAVLTSHADHNGTNGLNGILESKNPDVHQLRSRIGDATKLKRLLAKSYLKQGEWQTALQRGDWKPEHVREVLNAYSAATLYNRDSYKAWHAWAFANFEVVTTLTNQQSRDGSLIPGHIVNEHVIPAIRGFFRSISLSNTSSLQDTLRLLTLWFTHGGDQDVNTAVQEGFSSVNIDTWLSVTPQLIARINQPNLRVRTAVHRLLADVGKAHPQALVYPLTVAMKSNVTRRSQSAKDIMLSMRTHSPKLV